MKETVTRRTFLQIIGIAGTEALTAALIPKSTRAEQDTSNDPEKIFNKINKQLQVRKPYCTIYPFVNDMDKPDFETTLSAIDTWGRVDNVTPVITKQNEISLDFLNWTTIVGQFNRLTTQEPIPAFPHYLQEGEIFGYEPTIQDDTIFYDLHVDNQPIEQLIPFEGNCREASKALWSPRELETFIPQETRTILELCSQIPARAVDIITTDGVFPTDEASAYPDLDIKKNKTYQVADTALTEIYKHNAVTMGAIPHGTPNDVKIEQMLPDNLQDIFKRRLDAVQNGEELSPTVVYLPYPIEDIEQAHFSEYFNRLEEMQMVIIASSGNNYEVSNIKNIIPPGVFCATSISGSSTHPRLLEKRSSIPDEYGIDNNGNCRVYALPERLPSLYFKPELHRSEDGLKLKWQHDKTITAGSSYANLLLTGIVRVAIEQMADEKVPFTIAEVENRLQSISDERKLPLNDEMYTVRTVNIPKLTQSIYPVTAQEPEIEPKRYTYALPVIRNGTMREDTVTIASAESDGLTEMDDSFVTQAEKELHENIALLLGIE